MTPSGDASAQTPPTERLRPISAPPASRAGPMTGAPPVSEPCHGLKRETRSDPSGPRRDVETG